MAFPDNIGHIKSTHYFKVPQSFVDNLPAKIVSFHYVGDNCAFLVFDQEITYSYHTGKYPWVRMCADWNLRLFSDSPEMHGSVLRLKDEFIFRRNPEVRKKQKLIVYNTLSEYCPNPNLPV